MSKYESLQKHLASVDAAQLPMTFAEVEQVLGFRLPPSARNHPAWWSNNRGTNVAVKAWRDAGWRTSRVSLPEQRVTFVRDAEAASAPSPADEIIIRRDLLTGAALKLLQAEAEEQGGDLAEAAAIALNKAGRRRLLETFSQTATPSGIDGTAVIRADRDGR